MRLRSEAEEVFIIKVNWGKQQIESMQHCVFHTLSESSVAFWSCFALRLLTYARCTAMLSCSFFLSSLIAVQQSCLTFLNITASYLKPLEMIQSFRVLSDLHRLLTSVQMQVQTGFGEWIKQIFWWMWCWLHLRPRFTVGLVFYSTLRPVSHRFCVFSSAPVITGYSFHTGNVSHVMSHPWKEEVEKKLIVASYGRDVHLSEFNSSFLILKIFEIWIWI